MDAKLKERAQKISQLRYATSRFTQPQIIEIAEVHFLLTGRKVSCTTCNVYGLISEISAKITSEPLIIKDMANAKIQFKHNAPSREVIRHKNGRTILITPETLNQGDNAEWIAKSKEYGHLVEETKAAKAEAAAEVPETKATTKTSAKK